MVKATYQDFLEYQRFIGAIPEFMVKYLSLPFMKRLKGIIMLCGMINASPHMYKFNLPMITRFDHSVNDAKITYNLTHSKEMTLASCFHDVASPTWCHVVDYMNKDYVTQESTEEKTYEILASSKELLEYLKMDGIRLEDIVDFKKYSICDLPRPKLCADRVENTLISAFAWSGNITLDEAKLVISSLRLYQNEDGETEIGLTNLDAANILIRINEEIDRLTHTKEDNYMMTIASELLRRCIDFGVVSYDDLFRMTESDLIKKIEENVKRDTIISEYYHMYKYTEAAPDIKMPEIKKVVLAPLVNGKRI